MERHYKQAIPLDMDETRTDYWGINVTHHVDNEIRISDSLQLTRAGEAAAGSSLATEKRTDALFVEVASGSRRLPSGAGE